MSNSAELNSTTVPNPHEAEAVCARNAPTEGCMTVKDIIAAVLALNIPLDSTVVFGSGPLALASIRNVNDVDLVVSHEVYDRLKSCGWVEKVKGPKDTPLTHSAYPHIEVHDTHWGFGSGYQVTLQQLLETVQNVEGVNFASLEQVVLWKTASGGPKHMHDVERIRVFQALKKG